MKILLATHNLAKFTRYKNLLSCFKDSIELLSLSDFNITVKAEEPFDNSYDNAVYKAKFYGGLSQNITLAIDESVRTNFLPVNEQPGVFVRRLNDGRELNDREMLDFWYKVFRNYQAIDKKFIWNFDIVYYNPKNKNINHSHIKQINRVAKEFSNKINPGYPMSSFLVKPGSNKPYVELSEQEKIKSDKELFQEFIEDFSKWISK